MSRKTKKVVCRASWRKVFSTKFERSSFSTPTRGYTHRPRPGILSALALITTVNFQIAVNRQVPVTAISSAFPFRIL